MCGICKHRCSVRAANNFFLDRRKATGKTSLLSVDETHVPNRVEWMLLEKQYNRQRGVGESGVCCGDTWPRWRGRGAPRERGAEGLNVV